MKNKTPGLLFLHVRVHDEFRVVAVIITLGCLVCSGETLKCDLRVAGLKWNITIQTFTEFSSMTDRMRFICECGFDSCIQAKT